MRSTIIHAPGDIRVENVPQPKIVAPTDAVIRTVATCVCGSDLCSYRGINPVPEPHPIGHEYVGIVEEVGTDVSIIKPGQFVIGSFFASDNTCAICQAGYQSRCVHTELMGAIGTQAEYARLPLADGTLVATPTSRHRTWCRASSPPRTCWAPAGSAQSLPRSGRARSSLWSGTGRSVSSRSWPQNSWAPNGSSP